MTREKLLEKLILLITTSGIDVRERVNVFAEETINEHFKALRKPYVLLAEIAIAIIDKSQDTLWLSDTETVVERIFSELGMDHDGDPRERLVDYLNHAKKAEQNGSK